MDENSLYERAQKDLHKVDMYRDTPVRLLGYANEVGEAFRAWVSVNVVRFSYVVATSYVFADTADKSRKTYQLKYSSSQERNKCVTFRALDTLIWQALASVIIPGFTINRVCFFSANVLHAMTKWPLKVQKLIATVVGLSTIPFIVKPIDIGVEIGMQSSVRKFYPKGVFNKQLDLEGEGILQ